MALAADGDGHPTLLLNPGIGSNSGDHPLTEISNPSNLEPKKAYQLTAEVKTRLENLGRRLAQKAITGMKRMEKRKENTISHLSKIQCMVTGARTNDSTDERRDKILVQMEERFLAMAEDRKRSGNYDTWMYRYYAGCIRTVLHQTKRAQAGEWKNNRHYCWVNIIHMILTHLLVTEGIAAIAIIFAYAGKAVVVVKIEVG